jgi:hypothetical protein
MQTPRNLCLTRKNAILCVTLAKARFLAPETFPPRDRPLLIWTLRLVEINECQERPDESGRRRLKSAPHHHTTPLSRSAAISSSENASSLNTSSVCSPSVGARRSIPPGVADSLTAVFASGTGFGALG